MDKYQIKKGDTLSKIAKQYGTTVDALAKSNNIQNPNLIQAGATLNIQPVKPITDPNRIDPTKVQPNNQTYNPPVNAKPSNVGASLDVVASRQPIQPQPVNPKEQIQGTISKLLNRDITAEKQALREQSNIQTRQDEYNRSLNDYKARKMSYEDKLEEMRQNKAGMSSAVLANEMEEYQRKANRDLANMAIGVELLQNNYQGAQQILNDSIADLQQDYDNKLKTAQIAYDFLQNDLTESEKMQAQAEIQRIADERNFEQQKLLADYNARLDRQNATFKASLSGGTSELTSAQITSVNNLDSVLKSLDTYKTLYESKVGKSGVNLFGTDAGALSGAYNALMFQIAQAAGTGALQAADREVVEAMIPNPTTVTGAFGGLRKGGKTGGLNAIQEARNIFINKRQATTGEQTTPTNITRPEDLRTKYNY